LPRWAKGSLRGIVRWTVLADRFCTSFDNMCARFLIASDFRMTKANDWIVNKYNNTLNFCSVIMSTDSYISDYLDPRKLQYLGHISSPDSKAWKFIERLSEIAVRVASDDKLESQ
jgi:hypothetical protein